MRRIDQLPGFTTRLSERAALRRAVSWLFLGLARLSLVLVGSGMTAGCIIEDPPPYSQPKKTPPRLDLVRAVPVIDDIIVRTRTGLVSFNVPVASEDVGDDLVAFLLLDYDGGSIATPYVDEVGAGTLDDDPTQRMISIDWTVDSVPGCHRVTLLVTHRGNLSYDGIQALHDDRDVALAVWWVNVTPPAGSTDPLMPCPLATGEN